MSRPRGQGPRVTGETLTDEQIRDLLDALDTERPNPLLAECPKCGAAPGELCASLAKRWQAERCRTLGVGMNGWRRTPHRERKMEPRALRDILVTALYDYDYPSARAIARERAAVAYNARYARYEEVL